VRSAVTILVFTTMAVGLNVVVGYCGLLDLGYVAFYAIGAYTAGWLASGQFQQVNFHFGSVGHQPRRARDPHLDLAGADHRRAADRPTAAC
jgi:ABC-type branched-subunit amino acid transport system permease subunit